MLYICYITAAYKNCQSQGNKVTCTMLTYLRTRIQISSPIRNSRLNTAVVENRIANVFVPRPESLPHERLRDWNWLPWRNWNWLSWGDWNRLSWRNWNWLSWGTVTGCHGGAGTDFSSRDWNWLVKQWNVSYLSIQRY